MPEEVKEPAYWLVVVDELYPPPPELHKFESAEKLSEFMRTVTKERKTAWLLPFYGSVLHSTTQGAEESSRFLITPGGEKVSVSIPAEADKEDEAFFPVMGWGYYAKIIEALAAADKKERAALRAPVPRRFEYVQEEPEDEGDSELDPEDPSPY